MKKITCFFHLAGMPANEIIMSGVAILFAIAAAVIIVIAMAMILTWLKFFSGQKLKVRGW